MFAINTINEVLNISAKLIFYYVSAFLFLAHLELLNSLQPLFILCIGFVLYMRDPLKYGSYRSHNEVTEQTLSILLMILGT
ncbi:MAG: hypothetical protein H6765_04205 [Candidatus Peribacteria bacterium]|nr:MAG: hypothetical protein H6765_04205 [Candidatus Peribacteria bacterium]